MKAIRVAALTMVLMAAATSQPVPPEDDALPRPAQAGNAAQGECYLINGVWICEP